MAIDEIKKFTDRYFRFRGSVRKTYFLVWVEQSYLRFPLFSTHPRSRPDLPCISMVMVPPYVCMVKIITWLSLIRVRLDAFRA